MHLLKLFLVRFSVGTVLTACAAAGTTANRVEQVVILPADNEAASALAMMCSEKGPLISSDRKPSQYQTCMCDKPRAVSVSRDDALANLRQTAIARGVNTLWILREWTEAWEDVHCPDSCRVRQHRIAVVGYQCDQSFQQFMTRENSSGH